MSKRNQNQMVISSNYEMQEQEDDQWEMKS